MLHKSVAIHFRKPGRERNQIWYKIDFFFLPNLTPVHTWYILYCEWYITVYKWAVGKAENEGSDGECVRAHKNGQLE